MFRPHADTDQPAPGGPDERVERLLTQADQDVVGTMSPRQLEELRRIVGMACGEPAPKVVDLRFKLPLPARPCYVNLLVGRDRRTSGRPRAMRPLTRFANMLAVLYLGVTTLITASFMVSTGCDTLPAPLVQQDPQADKGGVPLDKINQPDEPPPPMPDDVLRDVEEDPDDSNTNDPPPDQSSNGDASSNGTDDASSNDTGDASSNGTGDASTNDTGDASSNGGGPNPPPVLPPLGMTFFTYTPDGALDVEGGFGNNPVYRPLIIDWMPKLRAYGFRRYMSVVYMGCAKDESTANAYFGPLADASEATGIQYVPGIWLHDIVANLYGQANLPPWNVTDPQYYLHHPMNPTALIEQRFWDDLLNRVRFVARGARSNLVWLECEYVFYQNKSSAFWSAENMAMIKPMLRAVVQQLQSEGIYLAWYHPQVTPYVIEITNIAIGLTQPESPTDPLQFMQHLEPSPYWRQVPWATQIPQPLEIDGWYSDRGFDPATVAYGFMSSHAGSGAWSPQQFHDHLMANPGLGHKTWYFCGTAKVQQFTDQFFAFAQNGTIPQP